MKESDRKKYEKPARRSAIQSTRALRSRLAMMMAARMTKPFTVTLLVLMMTAVTTLAETVVTSSTTTMTTGTYRVTGDVTIENRITITGEVKLLLDEGATLNALNGIGVSAENTLTIDGSGMLRASAQGIGCAGIGGTMDYDMYALTEHGHIIINGGTVIAQAYYYGAGIGGGNNSTAGSNSIIEINGGVVYATGGNGGAGIGGGYEFNTSGKVAYQPGVIIINGGQVTARGGENASGIGRGKNYQNTSGSITLGWTNATDFIDVDSYNMDEDKISFVQGKSFVIYGDWTTGATVNNIGDKKIVPPTYRTNMANATVSGLQDSYPYSGSIITLNYSVAGADDSPLTEGTHYSTELRNSKNEVISKTDGAYKLNDCDDYTLTFTGITPYDGTHTKHFSVVYVKDIGAATVSGMKDYYLYTGDPISLDYTVTAADGTPLEKGVHFIETLSPSTVQEKGDYTLTITGEAPYTGSQSFSFTVGDGIPVTSETKTMTTGFYHVAQDVTIENRITIVGEVTLILAEGATLNATKGIGVESENTLIIDGLGTLQATGAICSAGIGGTVRSTDDWSEHGHIIINGGSVIAQSDAWAAAIGGGVNSTAGNNSIVEINGGVVNATGGANGAGIGGGWALKGGGQPGVIIINGGQVTARGGESAPGIGRGKSSTDTSGSLTLGWTNETDFIDVDSYDISSISFADGKYFYWKENDVITGACIENIGGKKIMPYVEEYLNINYFVIFKGIAPYYLYTGNEIVITPEVVDVFGNHLEKGTHYNISFSPSTVKDVGEYTLTITGIDNGGFTGSKSINFSVVQLDLADATVTGVESYYLYTGDEIVITPEVVDNYGNHLEEGTHYDISFSPSPVKDVGEYTLTITATSAGYSGSKTFNFTVGYGIPVTTGTTELTEPYYYVPNDVTISNRITVSGDVTLILTEGKTLTASKGIELYDGNKLTIEGKGSLIATGTESYSGIGSERVGTLVINDGVINATGGQNAAGIGGQWNNPVGGTIIINGGEVTATGGYGAAGIGGSSVGVCGTVAINGGKVRAKGGVRPGDHFTEHISGTVTLDWTNEDDYIYSASYENVQSLIIADGKTLVDDDGNNYSGTLTAEQKTAIAGKTLRARAMVVKPPYTQDFTYNMDGWTVVDGVEGTGITSISNPNFRFNNSNSNQYLISPQLDLGAVTKLSFAVKNYAEGTTQYPAHYQVGISKTTKDLSAFTSWADEMTVSDGNVHIFLLYLPADAKYVIIKYIPENWLFIDNISFEAAANVNLIDNGDNTTVIETNDGITSKVTLQGRTFYRNGTWNTLCLPFSQSIAEIAASSLAGATIKELDVAASALTDDVLTLNFKNVTSIEAGKPYIVKWDSDADLVIKTAAEWNTFAESVNDGTESFAGKTVLLGADISGISTMVGTSEHPFCGTFDGGGHTLALSISGGGDGAAPFRYINGATIRYVKTTGSVSGGNHTAGIVGFAQGGTNSIHHCQVSAAVAGSSYVGGIVGNGTTSTTTVSSCYFNGYITGSPVALLYGWGDSGGTHTVENSVGMYSQSTIIPALSNGTCAETNCIDPNSVVIGNGAYLGTLGGEWADEGGEIVLRPANSVFLTDIENPEFQLTVIDKTAPAPVAFDGGTFTGTFSPLGSTTGLLFDEHNTANGACRAYLNIDTPNLGGFEGWYADATLTTPATIIPFDEDGTVKLYAKWAGSPQPVSVTFAKEGYSTYYDSQYDLALPAGMKARIVTAKGDGGTLIYETIADGDGATNTVPAGTAVMLQVAESTDAQTLSIDLTAKADNRTFASNLLHGSDTETTTTGDGLHYKLSYNTSGSDLGWYWGAAEGAAFTSAAHKVWLVLPSTAGTRGFFGLPGDDATTIDNSQLTIDNWDGAWYSIDGRKLSGRPSAKGLYIHNGRKVAIK